MFVQAGEETRLALGLAGDNSFLSSILQFAYLLEWTFFPGFCCSVIKADRSEVSMLFCSGFCFSFMPVPLWNLLTCFLIRADSVIAFEAREE